MTTSEQFIRLLSLSQQHGITIDYEGVPLERRSDRRFFETYERLYNEVTNLNWVSAFCLHEAGHRLYLAQAGATEFNYIPPTIRYNELIDDYDGYYAAVQAKTINPQENMPLTLFVWLLAKAKAAGAVFSEQLANALQTGEGGDRQDFDEDCSIILKNYPAIKSIDADSMWAEARNEVLQEMKNPANVRAAFETAEEIKANIFPWIKSPITPFPKPSSS